MTRLTDIVFIAALIVAAFSMTASPPPAQAAPPNFVVILCDDLGYGDLGCYGHPTIKTPHLDKLAGEGIRLTSCYASAPVCSSSRAGMMTGRTPSRVGVYDWIPNNHPMHLRQSEVTIASLLQQKGYATAHVGKWHLNGKFNSDEQPQPNDQGFDYWFSTQNNAGPSHHNPRNFVRNGERVGDTKGYSCQIVADEAIHWLKARRKKDEPFFMFVCFHEPHEPIASPPAMVADYSDAKKRGEALYYANVTNMDAAVGKLVKAIDDMKLGEETLIFFTSDNGPETLNRYRNAWRSHGSPGPLRGMKLWMYEGGIRVPGILRWTGRIKPGQTIAEPVCGLDVLPTLCELADVEPPKDRAIDGASFGPLVDDDDDNNTIPRDNPLYWHYFKALGDPRCAMRVGDYMILGIREAPPGPGGSSVRPGDMQIIKSAKLVRFELYNLKEDVAQKNNLAEQEPELLKTLSTMLVKKFEEVQKEGPVWEVGEEK